MEARRNTRKIAVQAVFQFFFSKEDVNKILEEFCNYRIKEFRNYKKKYDTDFLKKVVVEYDTFRICYLSSLWIYISVLF